MEISNETASQSSNESSHEIVHETTIFAEPIFHIGNFTITNSLINTWLVVFLFIIISLAIRKKLSKIPNGIQNIFEIIIEGALNLCDSVTNSRKKSMMFFPLVFALFLFILINNWSGLLPGVGSIGFIETNAEGKAFIPLFRGGTADVNTTLALAFMSIVLTHVFGIIVVGGWKYINKFINIKSFLEIPKKFIKDPSIALVNPIKAFVGVIECISEIVKVASLAFRLFGNIFAGEVLLTSISVMLAFFAPIPFIFLEIIVGLIQALVFSMLILVFLSIATTEEAH